VLDSHRFNNEISIKEKQFSCHHATTQAQPRRYQLFIDGKFLTPHREDFHLAESGHGRDLAQVAEAARRTLIGSCCRA